MSEPRTCIECECIMAETHEFWHCNMCDHHILKPTEHKHTSVFSNESMRCPWCESLTCIDNLAKHVYRVACIGRTCLSHGPCRNTKEEAEAAWILAAQAPAMFALINNLREDWPLTWKQKEQIKAIIKAVNGEQEDQTE